MSIVRVVSNYANILSLWPMLLSPRFQIPETWLSTYSVFKSHFIVVDKAN